LAGLTIGAAACFYPALSGSGGILAEHALLGEVALRWLPLFIVLRFALTMVSYGSGAAGGFFAPLLVLGALGGLSVGSVGHHFMPGIIPHPEIFAVVGMGALFTASVRAPLTGIVLMVELTGQYGFMLPLLTSCLVAYGVAEWRRNPPIYEALRFRNQHPVTTDAKA
jgi:CIC family chloride channel protein